MPQSITQSRTAAQTQVSQQPSTSSLGVEQPDLFGTAAARKPSAPVDKAYLFALPSLRRAIQYSLNLADMEPKEAYMPLQKDKATWSRILSGAQEVPASLLKELKALTGNAAALMWHANDNNCEYRELVSDVERERDALRAELAQERHDREVERAYARQMLGQR